MPTGRDDYREQYDRRRDAGDVYDERMRDARWRDDERPGERVRNSLRPEGDVEYRPGERRRDRDSVEPRARYRDDDANGRAAYGRDQYGRDDYGAYGDAVAPGPPHLAGKGPKGWQRSDERIREDVSEALARHSELDPSDIEVEVDGGEVTLSGTVSDRRTKRMVEDVAETIFAVKDVHNHLRIRRQGEGEARGSDRSATARGNSGANETPHGAKGRTSADSSSPNSK